MAWEVLLVEQVDRWFLDLAKTDPDSAEQVEAAINVLEREGPTLGTRWSSASKAPSFIT